jgi:CO/xanthine dehydrogenase Mo-binding subunit
VAEGRYSPAGSPLLAAGGKEAMSSIFWMFATHAAEVEVDRSTGVVKVLKIAAAHDVGTAVNPIGCETDRRRGGHGPFQYPLGRIQDG